MERSEQINELAAALCAAQAEIDDAEKVKTNPAFRSRYADLGSVWDAVKPALKKHGLSVAQIPLPSESGFMALETVLIHKSGQFISGVMTMPLAKNDPQGFGSALTYGRRYGLSSMLGVCPEDDDANAATRHQQPSRAHEGERVSTATTVARHMESNGQSYPGADGIWHGPGQCPTCHAPEGKPHAKSCATVLQPA